jgi:hypothetical protein
VGVEKVHFYQNNEDLGNRKCLGKPRKSFVGHPNAILFSRISREGVFQQPQAITPTTQAGNGDNLDKFSVLMGKPVAVSSPPTFGKGGLGSSFQTC